MFSYNTVICDLPGLAALISLGLVYRCFLDERRDLQSPPLCITLTGCCQALLSLLGEISHRVAAQEASLLVKEQGLSHLLPTQKICSLGVMSAFPTSQMIQAKGGAANEL